MGKLSRRDLVKAGVTGAAAGLPFGAEAQQRRTLPPPAGSGAAGRGQAPAQAQEDQAQSEVLFFFNSEEAAFVNAAIDRLIPANDWAGAREAGVLYYIDRQLAAAYGAGARMYLEGPWDPDAPAQQGYQLRYTPAQLYRIGIAETRAHVRGAYQDRDFADLDEGDLDSVLTGLERGDIALPSVPSPVFFETLLANTVEGYFADPIYGGNRDMTSWRMIGFPGAYAQYLELVDKHGIILDSPPLSVEGAVRSAHDHMSGTDHTRGKE